MKILIILKILVHIIPKRIYKFKSRFYNKFITMDEVWKTLFKKNVKCKGKIIVSSKQITLRNKKNNILGRSFVVDKEKDDLGKGGNDECLHPWKFKMEQKN